MRVLVHVHDLGLGGTQLNAVDFAAALRRTGVETGIVGPADTRPAGPSLVEVAGRARVPLVAYTASERLLPRAAALSSLARRWRADVVHVYSSWGARPAFWGPCLLGRRPLVQTVYEMAVDPDTYRHTPLVVGTGYLVDDLAARPGRTVLISPPVDLGADDAEAVDPTAFVTALDLPPRTRRLVTVTRLDTHMKARAVSTATAAVERLGLTDVSLVVVGGGDAERTLRREADDVNARLGRQAVAFTGLLASPGPAYASADVVLGMGGSAARALAFGKPLVAQGEHGWSDVFEPRTSAAIFRNSFWSLDRPEEPVDLLAGHLARLLADESLRASLGAFGRRFAREHFGVDEMADRLARLYEQAVAEAGPARWARDLGPELRVLRDRWGRDRVSRRTAQR